MAEYMILICEDQSAYATATPDVLQQVMEAHNRFSEQVAETGGKIIEGRALQPTSTATSMILPPVSATCSENRLCASITCWSTSGVAVA